MRVATSKLNRGGSLDWYDADASEWFVESTPIEEREYDNTLDPRFVTPVALILGDEI